MNDESIIELYWQRDERAIDASDRKYGGYCQSIAFRILGNAESGEECVNDTWLRAWGSIPPQRPRVLRCFFGTITRHLALNRARDLSREKRGGGEAVLMLEELGDCVSAAPADKELEDAEITASIERWLLRQPKENRVAFLRRYWYCDSLAEVARRMAWSESRINALLRRMRVSLKQHLETEDIFL